MKDLKIIVVGGGAAGFFGAIACKEAYPHSEVTILEKTRQLLTKVKISGGGRCNVTHACFDISTLVKNYPRGEKALRSPFTKFQPQQTIDWFLKRGVTLKTEADGRMFPVTDSSETIIHCLMTSAKKAGVIVKLECAVQEIIKDNDQFLLKLVNGEIIQADRLLIATGSQPKMYELLKALGHRIEPLVPSLFTFNVPDSPLKELSGIAVQNVHLKIENTTLEQTGPLLITHFGFSGPAVLKLSAFGARTLSELSYNVCLKINWIPEISYEELKTILVNYKAMHGLKLVTTDSPLPLPKNLWKNFCTSLQLDHFKWSEISLKQIYKMIEKLKNDAYLVRGKTTFKEEFVTCGGIALDEVDFKTMQSRIVKGLYFAGEVLNIDGITGGFNFQNAWTTSWIAGNSMGTTTQQSAA